MSRVASKAPVTAEMVKTSAEKYGIQPEVLAAFLQADSGFGQRGLGAGNMNPGNVGQYDRLGTQAVAGYKSWQEGTDAAAENLAKRQSALSDVMDISPMLTEMPQIPAQE